MVQMQYGRTQVVALLDQYQIIHAHEKQHTSLTSPLPLSVSLVHHHLGAGGQNFACGAPILKEKKKEKKKNYGLFFSESTELSSCISITVFHKIKRYF